MKKEIIIALVCAGLMLVTPFTTIAQENKVSSNLIEQPDIEPKDYLFQTIIDITNNPDVKKLLEQHNYDLFKIDIDRSIYNIIFCRNPRLFYFLIFNKPSISQEYLNFVDTQGDKIIDVIGKDYAIEISESAELIDKTVLDEISSIIRNDKKLSENINNLNKLNVKIESDGINDILKTFICGSLLLLTITLFIITVLVSFPLAFSVLILSIIPYKDWRAFLLETYLKIVSPLIALSFASLFLEIYICSEPYYLLYEV